MSADAKKCVLHLLEEYRMNIRKIAQLRYELEHPALVSPAEIMEAMTFAKGTGEGSRPTGYVSDKTLYIAMNYQDTASRLNDESREEIVSKLIPLEREVDRLEHYIQLLPKQQATLLCRHFFDGVGWNELCAEMRLSPKTLRKLREEAIDALAEMYEFAGVLS